MTTEFVLAHARLRAYARIALGMGLRPRQQDEEQEGNQHWEENHV